MMPWQRLVADVAGEYDPVTGVPFYREVAVTVPRQSGKTTLVLATECDRAVGFGEKQLIAYTAQTGWDARKKLIDEQVPMLEVSRLAPLIPRVLRGVGNEVVEFVNGSRIFVLGSSASAGHGRVIDLGVIDEAFADDGRREQAILPAMATRRFGQLMLISTAGDQEAVYFRRKVDDGRLAAEEDSGSGVAYFEWSKPDGVDPDDEDAWHEYMPALGHTISVEAVRHARKTMEDNEFRRAFCNEWTESNERSIPADMWDRALDPAAAPEGRIVFGVDCSPDRSDAAIVVSDGTAVELVDYRPGVTWVVDRCAELAGRHRGTVALDAGGPAGTLVPDLRAAGVDLVEFGARELSQACVAFFDALADDDLRVRPDNDLTKAVAGATRRKIGESWAWARREGAAPLLAMSIAVRAALTGPGPTEVWAVVE